MAKSTQSATSSPSVAVAPNGSYLEWGPVFGGTVIAAAISVIFFQFGSAVGLAVGEPMTSGGQISWNVLAAGLWAAVMAIASSAAGGYVAGRMRATWGDGTENEVEFRDGTHGLVVWATATLVAATALPVIAALGAAGGAAVAATTSETAANVTRIAGNISVIFAFATAAGSALGAAAGWFAAVLGGEHRDQGVDVHSLVPGMFRR